MEHSPQKLVKLAPARIAPFDKTSAPVLLRPCRVVGGALEQTGDPTSIRRWTRRRPENHFLGFLSRNIKKSIVVRFLIKAHQHNLSSVEEITKLSFPDDKVLGIVNRHPVLEPEHGLLAQRTVGHFEPAGTVALVGHAVQRNKHFILDLED